MQQRALGRTGRTVVELGFGGRRLTRDRERALHAAIDRGVDLIDVSPAWGESENLAGEAIRALRARDRVVLATAASPRDLQRDVERSLRATRLDAIPLAQLDGFHDGWLERPAWPEVRATMERLVREGKVLWWGAIADDPRGAGAAVDEPLLATIQVPFHIQDRRAGELIERAPDRCIVRRPLDGGALSPIAPEALAFVLDHPIACALVGGLRP